MKKKFELNQTPILSGYFNDFVIFLFVVGCLFSITSVLEAGAWVLSGARWTEKDEKVYEDFVKALGESGYGNVNRFVKDSKLNPLYGEEDKVFNLSPDCADLPYVVRAYVAYKLRLPFLYMTDISGRGGDQRYSNGNRPQDEKDQDGFSSPQNLFSRVTLINSGYYRMGPEIQGCDTYPVKIQKSSIVPGTIYYDPNGHVGLVYQVTPEGRIRIVDAHPDRSLSRPWFGAKFAMGNKTLGAGFRRWRPIWYSSDGHSHRQPNINIPDFSDSDQYMKKFRLGAMENLSYFDYVRFKLSEKGGRLNPIEEFRSSIYEIHEDIKYRVTAVEICLKDGINKREHPGSLPWNIYGTDGDWEKYSTPSRDARLKVAFQEFFNRTVQMIRMAENGDPSLEFSGDANRLAKELLSIYDNLTPLVSVSYLNSQGKQIALNFHEIVQRLFMLSFDPYHSVEYRWGATGEELKTSPDGPLKQKMYKLEARLRNQLERVYNCPTPYDLGPENPMDINVRQWLSKYLSGEIRSLVVSAPTSQANTTPLTATVVPDIKTETNVSVKPNIQIEPGKQMLRLAGSLFKNVDDIVLDLISLHLKSQIKN